MCEDIPHSPINSFFISPTYLHSFVSDSQTITLTFCFVSWMKSMTGESTSLILRYKELRLKPCCEVLNTSFQAYPWARAGSFLYIFCMDVWSAKSSTILSLIILTFTFYVRTSMLKVSMKGNDLDLCWLSGLTFLTLSLIISEVPTTSGRKASKSRLVRELDE